MGAGPALVSAASSRSQTPSAGRTGPAHDRSASRRRTATPPRWPGRPVKGCATQHRRSASRSLPGLACVMSALLRSGSERERERDVCVPRDLVSRSCGTVPGRSAEPRPCVAVAQEPRRLPARGRPHECTASGATPCGTHRTWIRIPRRRTTGPSLMPRLPCGRLRAHARSGRRANARHGPRMAGREDWACRCEIRPALSAPIRPLEGRQRGRRVGLGGSGRRQRRRCRSSSRKVHRGFRSSRSAASAWRRRSTASC